MTTTNKTPTSTRKEEFCPVCGNRTEECVCCPECGHECVLDQGGLYCPVCGPAEAKNTKMVDIE